MIQVIPLLVDDLKYAVIGKSVSTPIGDHDKNKADDRFKQSDGSRKTEIPADQADTINERVDNIAFRINERIIQVENLIEARIQNIT